MLCESDKGPIFFIVARGKFSEGKNFSGKLARAVIMVGVSAALWFFIHFSRYLF